MNEDNKVVLQMFADSSFKVRIAAWEKAFASFFASLVEKIADISVNRSRDCKGP